MRAACTRQSTRIVRTRFASRGPIQGRISRDSRGCTLTIVFGLVPVALWLWMARASGQGRNWARGLSTALFGVATLDLTGAFATPGIRVEFVPMLFGPTLPVLTWLVGLAAVWLVWLPASTAFFRPQGVTRVPPARPRLPGQPPRLL
jgi:hypothetical protein